MTGITEKIADKLHGASALVVIALLLVQVAIVGLRYVFSIGWSWALDLLVYLFFISAVLPGMAVIFKNASVRVDIFYSHWPQRRRFAADRLALMCLLAPVAGYTAWSAWDSVVSSWSLLESSPTFGGLPGYFLLKTLLWLYFIGFALVAVLLASRRNPYNEDTD